MKPVPMTVGIGYRSLTVFANIRAASRSKRLHLNRLSPLEKVLNAWPEFFD